MFCLLAGRFTQYYQSLRILQLAALHDLPRPRAATTGNQASLLVGTLPTLRSYTLVETAKEQGLKTTAFYIKDS